MSDVRRPASVSDRIWKVTDKGTVPSITIHYSNDRGGARSADQDGVELALLGYGPVSRATTGPHANLGRTALNVAAAVGMARVIGLGIFKSSRNPGDLLVSYQKQHLTDDQQASILAHSPLANRIARERLTLPYSIKVLSIAASEVGRDGIGSFRVSASVTNRDDRTWRAYDLELLVWDPVTGFVAGEGDARFEQPLAPGTSTTVTVTKDRVRQGAFEVILGVRRVLRDGAWLDFATDPLPAVQKSAALSREEDSFQRELARARETAIRTEAERVAGIRARRDSTSPGPGPSAEVDRNLLGKQAEKEGRVADAIVLYEENVAASATAPFPYRRLGVIYRRQRRFADEVRVLDMQRVTYADVGWDVSGIDRRLALARVLAAPRPPRPKEG